MVIRPMNAVYALGELGRPAIAKGEKGGPPIFFPGSGDSVSLSGGVRADAGLYSAKPLFKMMGAVELMSDDTDSLRQAVGFADRPVLI